MVLTRRVLVQREGERILQYNLELLDLKLRQRDGLLVIRLAFYVSLQVIVFLLLGRF